MVNSKRKGNRGELEVVNRLKLWFFEEFWKIERRGTSEEAAGKELGFDINTNLPLVIQVQFSNKPSPTSKYEEAEKALKNDTSNAKIAVAFTKKTNGKWLATLDMDAFCALLASHIRTGSAVNGILGIQLPASDSPEEVARFMVQLLDMRARADLAPVTDSGRGSADAELNEIQVALQIDRDRLAKLVDGPDEYFVGVKSEGPAKKTAKDTGEMLN
jgi:hypothetical protein